MGFLDKKERVKTLLGDDAPSDEIIFLYLEDAKEAILDRLYPFGRPEEDSCCIPDRYGRLQCDLAIRYINRRGAEGEIIHTENGINRSYSSVNDEDLLSVVVPYAKVM